MVRTYSDLSNVELDFIIHNFNISSTSDSSPTSQTQILLNAGRSIIRAANARSGWIAVDVSKPLLKIPTDKRSHCFICLPPNIARTYRTRSAEDIYELKEWNEPASNDEIFILGHLEDFKSTDFSHLSTMRRTLKRASSTNVRATPPKKRKMDFHPLHNVIPSPHFYASPYIRSPRPPKIGPYTRTKPIPIPPHTLSFPSPPPHSRRAWLIPVRGILPWDHCTAAAILDLTEPTQIPVPSNPRAKEPDRIITWTHASLESLWSFLVALRKSHNVGTMGLSFHAAPTYSSAVSGASSYEHSPLVQHTTFSDVQQGAVESHTQLSGSESGLAAPAYICRVPLSAVDHIKIYHEADNSMILRNALDVWAYEVPDECLDGLEGVKRKKYGKARMLKGAKLVLLDERSKGVLIA